MLPTVKVLPIPPQRAVFRFPSKVSLPWKVWFVSTNDFCSFEIFLEKEGLFLPVRLFLDLHHFYIWKFESLVCKFSSQKSPTRWIQFQITTRQVKHYPFSWDIYSQLVSIINQPGKVLASIIWGKQLSGFPLWRKKTRQEKNKIFIRCFFFLFACLFSWWEIFPFCGSSWM